MASTQACAAVSVSFYDAANYDEAHIISTGDGHLERGRKLTLRLRAALRTQDLL